jgi:hypothetical protein
MGADLTGLGEVATSAEKILGMIFPDKTQIETQKMAGALALITAQTAIDNTEAASTDPLQHWRGGLGWVCVAGYAYNFFLQPVFVDLTSLIGHPVPLHALDITQLVALTTGMLGLGTMHVVGQIKGVK